MPITIRCPITDSEAEFADIDAAIDAGWRQSSSNSEWYSPEAMNNGTFCQRCDCYIDYDDGEYHSDVDGEIYCQDCWVEEGGYWCPHCEEEYWQYDVPEQEVRIYDGTHIGGYTEHWCTNCANNEATWNETEEIYEYDRDRTRNNREQGVQKEPKGIKPEICEYCKQMYRDIKGDCERCLENQAYNKMLRETSLWVYDTRFSPRGWYHPEEHKYFKQLFYRDKNEHPFLYYGLEIEVGFEVHNMSPNLREVAKNFIEMTNGLFVAESDSSIGVGIEFISRPTSYKMWTAPNTIIMLRKAFQYLREQGAYIEQPATNGIHIHMSRKFFEHNTKKNVVEINKDLDWVFQYYQPEIETISQRKFTNFCESKMDQIKKQLVNNIRYNNLNDLGAEITLNARLNKSILQDGRTNHHAAITMRDATVEVRCFKSSIDVDTIISYIELVRNIAHTARNKDIKNMTMEEILASKDSPRLDTYIYKLKRSKNLKLSRKIENSMKKEFKTEDITSQPF